MSRRRILATLGLTAAAATAVLAAPTGDTQARWTETRTTVVPTMTVAAPAVAVTDVPITKPFTSALQATLKNTAGYGVEYRPYQVNLAAMPGTPTTSTNASDFLGYKVLYDYTGCSSSTAVWTTALGTAATTAVNPVGSAVRKPLPKAASVAHCVIVKPGMDDATRYSNFAGREFQVTTTGRGVSVAGTATQDWTWRTRYVVPIPTPLPQSSPCSNGLFSNVRLWWAWPDASGTSSGTIASINRWEIWYRVKGSTGAWTKAVGNISSNKRDNYVGTGDVGNHAGALELVVRAYPFTDTTRYAESSVIYNATSPGSMGFWTCQAPTTNPNAGMQGY